MFSTLLENFLPFSSNLKLSSENSFSLEASEICCLVKDLQPFTVVLLNKKNDMPFEGFITIGQRSWSMSEKLPLDDLLAFL